MGQTPQSHFRDWLRMWQLSGCLFAAKFGGSSEGLIFYELMGDIEDLDTDELARFLDHAGNTHRVAVLLGPDMRGDDDIATLLRVLAQHPRWDVQLNEQLVRDSREIGVSMSWTTEAARTTNAMGFAPSAYMPASRRSPYPALAAWTGGHENEHRTRTSPDHVIIGDAPPPEGNYDAMMTRTQERSKQLRDLDTIGRKRLRQLAFRLDRRAIESKFPDLLS